LEQKYIRVDFQIIANQIKNGSRVLDVGCGDGALLAYLREKKEVDGRGLELSMSRVRSAVGQGLPVIHGNLETDLKNYPKDAFDYVILSQTLQATRNPKQVIKDLLRLGKVVVVSFPNFGYWRVRTSLLLNGMMPTTETLPHTWYDTENIHLCTIKDFVGLVDNIGVKIRSGYALNGEGKPKKLNATSWLANLISQQAIFFLGKE